jgi:hypothetical protein
MGKPMFLQDHNISTRKEYSPHILRIAKIARQKSRINAKAKDERNQSQTVQPPYLKLKRKPGARKGNRNALKHGLYTAEMAAMKIQVCQAIAEMKLAAAQVRMQAALMDRESRARLRAAKPVSLRLPELPKLAMEESACWRMR